MNQVKIKVELGVIGEEDVLKFYIPNSDGYNVSLNSSESNEELKVVFSSILKLLLENDDIVLDYCEVDGYSKGLYKDVCKEYVDALNEEIKNVKNNILKDLE